jgi:hypothetical protein
MRLEASTVRDSAMRKMLSGASGTNCWYLAMSSGRANGPDQEYSNWVVSLSMRSSSSAGSKTSGVP